MKEVIRRIIEIEESAQQIMETTKQESQEKIAQTAKALKEMEKKLLGDAQNKINQIRDRELMDCKEEMVEMKAACYEKIHQMEVKAIENEEAWVKFLVDQVISYQGEDVEL